MPYEIDENDIRKFYKDINILNVHHSSKDAVDIEFPSKDQLIKAIDLGTGSFKGQPFYMRSSYYRIRNSRTQGRDDRGGRGRGRGRYNGSRGGYK